MKVFTSMIQNAPFCV